MQQRLRDRFLFALLFESGMRVGQALGLRHEDVVSWERRIEIRPREDNANGARGKGGRGSVPVSAELMRLHLDYMHQEYGDLDCDYVFVNLWGGRRGAPMRYHSVYELAKRTSARVGFQFTEERGQGVACAAVRMMISSALPAFGLRSVVLDIEAGNVSSTRLAQRLGAERRSPTRVEADRAGTARTLVVYVLQVASG